METILPNSSKTIPAFYCMLVAALLLSACSRGVIGSTSPDAAIGDSDGQTSDSMPDGNLDAGADTSSDADAGVEPDGGDELALDGDGSAGDHTDAGDEAYDGMNDADSGDNGGDSSDGMADGADDFADSSDGGPDSADDGGTNDCIQGAIEEEDCDIPNGTGRRTTVCLDGTWSAGGCLVVRCDDGFFPQDGACVALEGQDVYRIEPKADRSNQLDVLCETSIAADTFTIDRVEKDGLEVSMPDYASLDPATGGFMWTPTPSQVAFYVFDIIARANDGSSEQIQLLIEVTMPEICTESGQACVFLKQRWDEGLAAGNLGDWYFNCDGFHTRLNMGVFPQLDLMTSSGCQTEYGTYPEKVVIGNESCAFTSGESWSSIPRSLMRWESSALRVYDQYRSNDHYWYPEHRDHDDVDYFHGKMPSLSVSQGSSGSEMDEVKRFVYIMAALRPDTKRALVAAGLLMPTIQMIFRRSRVDSDAQYLTGAAHPSAFDNFDATLDMVQMANDISPDHIPPMAQLEVVDETYTTVDGKNEQWFTLPVSICRIFRGPEYTKRIRVSAEASYDINGQPLTYHWVVLRGDPEHVRIQTVDEDGKIADIEIDYHPKTTIGETTRLTNMVEVGVFVHNGVYYSAPAFVTSYTLDNEERTYDQDGNLIDLTTNDNYVYPPLL